MRVITVAIAEVMKSMKWNKANNNRALTMTLTTWVRSIPEESHNPADLHAWGDHRMQVCHQFQQN